MGRRWFPLLGALAVALFDPRTAAAGQLLDVKAGKTLVFDVVNNEKAATISVEEGLPVAVECNWTIEIVDLSTTWTTSKFLPYESVIRIDHDTLEVFTENVPAGITLGAQGKSSTSGFKGHAVNTTGLTSLKGSQLSSKTWIAQGVGAHTAECEVNYKGQLSDSNSANNKATAAIFVVAKKAVPSKNSTWKSTPAAKKALGTQATAGVMPGAGVSVMSAVPKLDPSCPNLSSVFIATVSLRNSGLPIAANQGHLRVFEVWGANLKSQAIPLPAFALNEVKSVDVPVEVPKVSVPSLAGAHKLGIELLPVDVQGQPAFVKPKENFVFSVNFPNDYCHAKGPHKKNPPNRDGKSGTELPAVQRPAQPPR